MTGWGVVRSFNAPSLPYPNSPGTPGSDLCVNDFSSVPPYGCVGIATAPGGQGYWIANACVGGYGTVPLSSSSALLCAPMPNAPVVGLAAADVGVWLAGADGGVFALAGAPYLGSMGGQHLNKPVVGMASTPDGKGYWHVASDGRVFAFGDAQFSGSTASLKLNAPMIGMAPNPGGTGYWLAAGDGGVFAFGDAPYLGSAVGQPLQAPIVGIASTG